MTRCAYCGRSQQRPDDGGCISCGAPLPADDMHEHTWLDTTCHGDSKARALCAGCGAIRIEEFDRTGFKAAMR
jgi:hypothetical protein